MTRTAEPCSYTDPTIHKNSKFYRKYRIIRHTNIHKDNYIMIKKKLCLLGSFGVGKTSLIRKYVQNIFSDNYLSTVGVKIDKKMVTISPEEQIMLLIWDLEGSENFNHIIQNYLTGISGCFLVADGTRPETLDAAKDINTRLESQFPGLPTILIANKYDLRDQWKLDKKNLIASFPNVDSTFLTSAKTGEKVEAAFLKVAKDMRFRDNA